MKAAIWMLGALISFCLIAIGVRELDGALPVFQILFSRSVIGLVYISLILLSSRSKSRQSPIITTDRIGLHSVRNLFHFAGQYGWFVGLGILPLAEVFALEFTVPVWTAIFATLFLHEQVTARKVAAIVLGLVGVLVIVRPGYEIIDSASLIVLGAALCYAVSHTATKSLTSTEDPISILFYMCAIQLPIGLVLCLPVWITPAGVQWFWLLAIALTALSAHYCMAKAMQTAQVTTVVILDFLRLPLIAVVGVLFYAEAFEPVLLVGGALMLFGNLVNVRRPAPIPAEPDQPKKTP